MSRLSNERKLPTKGNTNQTRNTWPFMDEVHCHLFRLQGHYYLLIVGNYSNFIVAENIQNN